MDLARQDIESLKEENRRLKTKLELAHKEYYGLVEKTNKHLQEIFDSSNDLIQIFKPNGDFRFVNKTWKNKLGYSEQEIFDMKFGDVIHPDYRKETLDVLSEISQGSTVERVETVLISRYGKKIYVIGQLICVFEGGEPTEYRCVFYDVTERFRAERAQSLYYKIASITIAENSLEQYYSKIYQELNDILKIRNFSVALKTDDGYTYPFWINEFDGKTSQALTRDTEELLAQYTMEYGRPLIIYQDRIRKIAEQQNVDLSDPSPSIWLGVLIQINKKAMGVLSIANYHDQAAYNHHDLELMDFLASQVTISLERKINEDKIENQAARLNAIFESSTHEICSIDKNYLLTSFNQNFADAFRENNETDPELGRYFFEQDMEEQTHKLWKNQVDQAFEGHSLNFQFQTTSKQGTKIWHDVFLNPIFLPGGQIEEISVIAHDITEKKEAQLAIQESEEKFRNIFESFQDIYFRCDPEGKISMVSPSVQEVLGYESEELLGQNITTFFESQETIERLFKKLARKRQVRNFEGRFRTKSGKYIEFLSNVRLIKRRSDRYEIEGVARDVTRLKQTNRELREAKDLAERSLKIKERFLANMSHEIRTPMNGIIGMIDLFGTTDLDHEQSEYIKTMKKSSESLLNILNDILDLSKIEAGKMQLRKEPFKIIDTFEKVYELYSQQAHLSNNSLFYHLDENLPEYIIGDETRFTQVLSNLTSNAIKFSPRKGNINISIQVLEQTGSRYRFKVSVKDSGIGISKEDIEKLFQSFSQIDSSSSKNFSGTGLGLAISKELVKSMGGEIGVASTPGLGSTFWFIFEADSIDAQKIPQKQEEEIFVRQFTESSPRVLLVDDNHINRNVASNILKKSGCIVVEAESGYDAIEKVQQGDYDLIFMDIQMPDMDGVEATRQIKSLQLENQPPIVAMTAYAMEEDQGRFLKEGLNDYIAKPIKADSLIAKVKTWLNFEIKEVKSDIFEEGNEELVINQNTLNQLYKYGGKELIESVLVEFDREATKQLDNIKELYLNKEYEKMLSDLHTLKGNSGTFGVEKVSRAAKDLEKLIKENKFDNLELLLNQLITYFDEFKESYRNFIEN